MSSAENFTQSAKHLKHKQSELMIIDTVKAPHRWRHLGPAVQSIVSLTSSLRVISLTVLADSIYIILIFFAEKMKLLTFFSKKHQLICVTLVNFNDSLTNDVVSFEQLGPGKYLSHFSMKTYIIVGIH